MSGKKLTPAAETVYAAYVSTATEALAEGNPDGMNALRDVRRSLIKNPPAAKPMRSEITNARPTQGEVYEL